MKSTWWTGVAAVAAVLIMTPGGLGDVAPENPDGRLRARVAELEAKSARDDSRIAELETRLSSLEDDGGEHWITRQRADEIRGLVADVLADADTRSSLLGGMTAGYDDGAVIASDDGNWLLRTNFYLQERFLLNSQSNSPGDGTVMGFENARSKILLSGNVVSPEWFYSLEIELSGINAGLPNGDSRTGLLDAFAGYDLGNGWKIAAGTFKIPLLREELIDTRFQQAVERSVVNYVYTGGRTDGFIAEYYGEKIHFLGSFNNGMNDVLYGGTVVTGGTSPISSTTADFAISSRFEWLFEGEWDQFRGFTSPQGAKRAMMLGGAIHLQTADDNIDLLVLTVDFTAKFNGANAFGSLIYTRADTPGADASPLALVLQGGYYFTEDWEGFARFEWSDTDTLSPDDILILTAGATYYLAGSQAKWTTDIGIGFDAENFSVPIADWRADSAGSDGQVVIRSQLQLAF